MKYSNQESKFNDPIGRCNGTVRDRPATPCRNAAYREIDGVAFCNIHLAAVKGTRSTPWK